MYIRRWGDVSPGMQTMSGGGPPSPGGGGAGVRIGVGGDPDGPTPMQIDEPYNGGGPPPQPPDSGAERIKVAVVDPGGSIREPILGIFKDELEKQRGSQAEIIKLMQEHQRERDAHAQKMLTMSIDALGRQAQLPQTVAQPQPPPDPFGGGGAIQAVRSGFDDLRGVLGDFRRDLTDIADRHARASAERKSAEHIQSMIKGLEVDIKRSRQQEELQHSVAQGIKDALSTLQRQPDPSAATMKGIEASIADLARRVQAVESAPPPMPTLQTPNTTLRTPALIKEHLWGANHMAEQQAAMEGVVKPFRTPEELYQEQLAIMDTGRIKRKLEPSPDPSPRGGGFFTDAYWPTGGAANPVKMEDDDL